MASLKVSVVLRYLLVLWSLKLVFDVNASQLVDICKFLTSRTYLFEDSRAKVENIAKNYQADISSTVHLIKFKKRYLTDLFRLILLKREW